MIGDPLQAGHPEHPESGVLSTSDRVPEYFKHFVRNFAVTPPYLVRTFVILQDVSPNVDEKCSHGTRKNMFDDKQKQSGWRGKTDCDQ